MPKLSPRKTASSSKAKQPASPKKTSGKPNARRAAHTKESSRKKPGSPAPLSAKEPASSRPTAKKPIRGNTSRDHLFRIFTIFSELQNGRRSKLSQLAEYCGVVERTIQRDIATMQTLLDIGITSENVKRISGEVLGEDSDKKYTLDPSQKHFPIVRIEEKDLLTIHYLRQCLEPYKETDIGKSMLESFKRSFGVLTGTTDWKKWARIVHFRFEGRPEVAKEDVSYFEILHKAILENRKVSFVYRSTNTPLHGEDREKDDQKESRVRILHPNFLFMRNGSWYLHAFDPDEEKEKIFKFARIRELQILGESFQPRARFPDTADYFRYSYAVIPCSEKPKEHVVLEFTGKSSARRVGETLWHPEQKLTKITDEKVRLELPFSDSSYLELCPWILSWGATVKVLGPKKLKEQVAKDIKAMAAALG